MSHMAKFVRMHIRRKITRIAAACAFVYAVNETVNNYRCVNATTMKKYPSPLMSSTLAGWPDRRKYCSRPHEYVCYDRML